MELILKLLMDGSFYLAVFMPILVSVGTVMKAVLSAVLILWWIWLAVNWKKRNLAETAYGNFIMESRILIFVQIFSLMLLGTGKWKRQCVPFLVCFLISGILLLRLVRLRDVAQEKKSFWSANGKEIFGVAAAAGLLSFKPVSRGAAGILGTVYETCILPVLEFIMGLIFDFFVWLWPYLERFLPSLSLERKTEETMDLGGIAPLEWTAGAESAAAPAWTKAVGTALLLSFLFLFLRYLYRRLSERGWGQQEYTQGEIRRSAVRPEEKKNREFREIFREKNVRYYYRRFLALCTMWGIETEKDAATSEEIGKRASRTWGMENELSELRDIYLRVRYGKKNESTEERKRAREIYRSLKEKAELRP